MCSGSEINEEENKYTIFTLRLDLHLRRSKTLHHIIWRYSYCHITGKSRRRRTKSRQMLRCRVLTCIKCRSTAVMWKSAITKDFIKSVNIGRNSISKITITSLKNSWGSIYQNLLERKENRKNGRRIAKLQRNMNKTLI